MGNNKALASVRRISRMRYVSTSKTGSRPIFLAAVPAFYSLSRLFVEASSSIAGIRAFFHQSSPPVKTRLLTKAILSLLPLQMCLQSGFTIKQKQKLSINLKCYDLPTWN